MQNIPDITIEKATEQLKTVRLTTVKNSDQQALFADLFDKHATRVENEMALAPVATKDTMLDTAPIPADEKQDDGVLTAAANAEEPATEIPDDDIRDERMTREDFEEVRDDLEEYGLSEEEIAELEEQVDSDEGLTWEEFVTSLAEKMESIRQITLSDEQKDALTGFFAKFGFTEKESANLISQLENGEQTKVMSALQAKLDAMPQDQKLLFTKDEVEAFSAVMQFSKELTSKVKQLFAENTLSKDVKEAFTLISQEMTSMDEKDAKLVKAVAKAAVQAMHDKVKESTAAKDLDAPVDLKARVGEDSAKTDAGPLKDAARDAQQQTTGEQANSTRENVKDENDAQGTRTGTEQGVKVAETKSDAKLNQEQSDTGDQTDDNAADSQWEDFFSNLKTDTRTANTSLEAKAESLDQAIKLAAGSTTDTQSKTKAWEKISAPKVMRQVEQAVIKNLGNGTKQLTLQLTPENLGKLSVMLQVSGKEVNATIKAENADAAKVIADNLEVIKNSLENQGLKVEKLEVQTGLTNNSDSQNWFSQEQHNLSREREAMVAMRNHMRRMRGGTGELAQDLQNIREQAIHADQGLHVIA